jgi:hypothetical protein
MITRDQIRSQRDAKTRWSFSKNERLFDRTIYTYKHHKNPEPDEENIG